MASPVDVRKVEPRSASGESIVEGTYFERALITRPRWKAPTRVWS
jgi:hypothetical protein